jgi:hypothetical protein
MRLEKITEVRMQNAEAAVSYCINQNARGKLIQLR